jgi:hypothetical protein
VIDGRADPRTGPDSIPPRHASNLPIRRFEVTIACFTPLGEARGDAVVAVDAVVA